MQRTFQHWTATKWLEIDQDNLRMKFSALGLNVDFSSLPPTFKEAGAGGRQRRLPPKKWLFYRNYLV